MYGRLQDHQIQKRRDEILALVRQLKEPMVMGVVSSAEDGFILLDAQRSYITGSDAAAVICAHSSCERDLLSYVWHDQSGTPPNNLDRWGLGKLISYLAAQLPASLATRLVRLNDSRKVLYHYGYGDTPSGLMARAIESISRDASAVFVDFKAAYGRGPDNKDLLDFEIMRILRRDALDGLGTALMVREWIAIGQATFADES